MSEMLDRIDAEHWSNRKTPVAVVTPLHNVHMNIVSRSSGYGSNFEEAGAYVRDSVQKTYQYIQETIFWTIDWNEFLNDWLSDFFNHIHSFTDLTHAIKIEEWYTQVSDDTYMLLLSVIKD